MSADVVWVALGVGFTAVGAGSASYPVVRKGFSRRRNAQRWEDRLRGWYDDQGVWHKGTVDRFDDHVAEECPPAHGRPAPIVPDVSRAGERLREVSRDH